MGVRDVQVVINQCIDWDSAPNSLVYYFATMVGDVPDRALAMLPAGTQELLRYELMTVSSSFSRACSGF